MLWAQVPADALDGANRTLVYWLVFALFSSLSISNRLGGALLLAWGTALAALGLTAVVEAGTAATTAGHFVQSRLAAPLSYPDGNAALFLSACLPLLVLASRPRAGAAARLTALVAAVVLADLGVLCQSRGSLVWFPCAILLYLAVARTRLRAFAHLVVAGVAVAPAVPALLHVYTAVATGHDRRGAVMTAVAWTAGSAALATVGLVALILLERHVTLSDRARVVLGSAVVAVAGGVVIAAAVIAVGPHPLGRAQRAWHNFGTHNGPAPTRAHFVAGLGTSRYDVWRIALRQFEAHPVTGVGADNYIVGYLRERRTHQTSRYPESIELRTFSETGIVGAALFLGFLVIALFRAARAARRSRWPGIALACFAGSGYWLLHASTDWFWEIPALTGAGLALLAIASTRAPTETADAPATARRLSPSLRAAAVGAALVTAAVLTIPWVSVSLVDAAVGRGPGRSATSLLDTAAKLNPWSEQPALAKATLAAKAGDRALERRAYLQALRRNPHDWLPYLMLGIVAGREHQPVLARRELTQARRLSPEDLVVLWAQRRLRWGNPLTEAQVDRALRGS
jgi:hypothetical protein